MKAQHAKIQTEGLQLNLFDEAVKSPAAVKKAKHTTKLEQQLANSEGERIKLLAQITELKTQRTRLQTALTKEQQVVEAFESLIKSLPDTLQRHEHLLTAMDEERQKAFRWSFAA